MKAIIKVHIGMLKVIIKLQIDRYAKGNQKGTYIYKLKVIIKVQIDR